MSDANCKLLFYHIPKCAGTSLIAALKKFFIKEECLNTSNYNFLLGKRTPTTYKDKKFIYGHHALDLINSVEDDFIKCTILRSPVDRIISHYFYVLNNSKHYLHDYIVKNKIDLGGYCAISKNMVLANFVTYKLAQIDQPKKMKSYFDANIVDVAYERLMSDFDLIGITENMDQYICKLNKLTNLNIQKFPKKNTGSYSTRSIKLKERNLIKEYNLMDIELYKRIQNILSR